MVNPWYTAKHHLTQYLCSQEVTVNRRFEDARKDSSRSEEAKRKSQLRKEQQKASKVLRGK